MSEREEIVRLRFACKAGLELIEQLAAAISTMNRVSARFGVIPLRRPSLPLHIITETLARTEGYEA